MEGVCCAGEPAVIHLLFTGGTIAMQRDPAAGGNVPAHGGEALVEFAPGLEAIAPYRIENWARLPACHLGPDRLWALRNRVCELAASGEVTGIVVTHGTDTIEETAYLLARTLPSRVPVAITGAMLTSSDEGWDGPRNLLDAARVAASPASAGRGAMVVFHGMILAGNTAVKTHATEAAAFSAPHALPLGRVASGRVVYDGPSPESPRTVQPGEGLTARVALVPLVVGDDGTMLDLARPEHDGVVVEAFGSGNMPPGAVPAVRRWLDDGKPVVLATRCLYGQVTPLYAFEGGGARTVALGAIPAGPRTPSQARMELMLALSAGVAYGTQ
jgi:L-asparaginase